MRRLIVTLAALAVGHSVFGDSTQFAKHSLPDNNGTGHAAVTYLLAKGWKTDDQLVWNLMQRTAPLQFITSATSADGKFAVRYRNVQYQWYTRTAQLGNKGTPAPEHPTEYALELFKKAHPGEVEVVDHQEKPVTSMFKPMATQTTVALDCSLKVRFTDGGTPMMAKIAFRYDGYDSGTTWGRAHGYSNGEWYLMDWSVISGPEAEFSKALRIGAVTLSSEHFDPEFFQQYLEVIAFLTQQIAEDGQKRLDELRASYHPLSSFNKQKFDEMEHRKDLFTRDMCDYVSDQQRFSDGSTQFIVPTGYSYAGEKENGDVILTNDPTYNRFKEWQEMRKVGPGED